MQNTTILVTGACGFLGRHTAHYLSAMGCSVYGIGHGSFSDAELVQVGLEKWISSDITVESLSRFDLAFDAIIHCAGGSSVAKSISDPAEDFRKTVNSTLAVLEFVRTRSPGALVVYPSSAAVYGEHDNSPIGIADSLRPVSPYGFHKKIAEELCFSYRNSFGVNSAVIRFFSIYGSGLRRQLIWDACRKLSDNPDGAEFWGTGDETRDWIHVSDAARLIHACLVSDSPPHILNGGSGIKTTIADTLRNLAEPLGMSISAVHFNGLIKKGDPMYYWADVVDSSSIGWSPQTSMEDGFRDYVDWFRAQIHD